MKKQACICILTIVLFTVFCVLVLTGVNGTVSFAGQAPPYGDHTQVQWPDVNFSAMNGGGVHIQVQGKGQDDPILNGDQVEIGCVFFVCGCYQEKAFSNKVEINNTLFDEKEADYVPTALTSPDCHPSTCISSGYKSSKIWNATPGNNTITCILDSKNEIVEGPQNEFNNKKSTTVYIPLPTTDKIKDMKTKPPITMPVPMRR